MPDYAFSQRDHGDECMCEQCIWHSPFPPTLREQIYKPIMTLQEITDAETISSLTRVEKLHRLAGRLPEDSKARKDIPMYSGLLAYFPLALAAVAKHSKESNDKHNPGEPLRWSREKSSDHMDCVIRHVADYSLGDQHALVAIAWRSLAQLELDEEAKSAAGQPSGERARG